MENSPTKYIDVHAHLESPRFEKDIEQVIQKCRQKKVIVINAGVNSQTNRKIILLKNKYPDVIKISFGLYPIDALTREVESGEGDFLKDTETFNVDEELNWIKENKNKCVAIGEVGLDYNCDEIKNSEELKNKQKEVFKKILDLATEIDKPVIIHSRKAEKDAIEILEEKQMKKVVMHCFCGGKNLIKRCLENKWFFSIPPVITRLEHFKMLVEMTPIEKILTETDSPYLSPVAGERNEPKNVIVTIKEIAKIKNLNEELVRKKILENTKQLLKI